MPTSTVPVKDFVWEQGSDFTINLTYKSGALATPVNLTNYKLRMDIYSLNTRVFTLNSDDIAETGVDSVGSADNEAVLSSNGDISISVPRSLTLGSGAIGIELAGGRSVFNYDIFLRDATNRQSKILTGTITVNKSYTLWQ